jgi:hypothetical protein
MTMRTFFWSPRIAIEANADGSLIYVSRFADEAEYRAEGHEARGFLVALDVIREAFADFAPSRVDAEVERLCNAHLDNPKGWAVIDGGAS